MLGEERPPRVSALGGLSFPLVSGCRRGDLNPHEPRSSLRPQPSAVREGTSIVCRAEAVWAASGREPNSPLVSDAA
jgi:hypothetical protein